MTEPEYKLSQILAYKAQTTRTVIDWEATFDKFASLVVVQMRAGKLSYAEAAAALADRDRMIKEWKKDVRIQKRRAQG